MDSGMDTAAGVGKAINEIDNAVRDMLQEPCYAEVCEDEFAADLARTFIEQENWSPAVKRGVANWYGITV